MDNSILKKAGEFDKDGLVKAEIEKALVALKDFRAKFPFVEKPKSIDLLVPDDIFKVTPDEVGNFFRYLEYYFKPVGFSYNYSPSVYSKISLQIEDFKGLLHVAVDSKKSLAEKVDAPWEKIKGLGDDKIIPKKIILCFNLESKKVLPIFTASHLKHFLSKFVDKPLEPIKYSSFGQEYASLTSELLKAKDSLPVTQSWGVTFFARFLYESFPPPDIERPTTNPSGEGKTVNETMNEQLELAAFVKLLGELQAKGKITGQEFRENRELWMRQHPFDRSETVWRLKKLLNTEAKKSDVPKYQPLKPRKL